MAEKKTTAKKTTKKPTKPRAKKVVPVTTDMKDMDFSSRANPLSPEIPAGGNTAFLDTAVRLFKMKKVDLKDTEAVIQRVDEFLMLIAERDQKATIAGLAMALGINRQALWSIRTGQPYCGSGCVATTTPEARDYIMRACDILEYQLESWLVNGKINPVAGIFLAKNNFSYVDKVEHVVTPNTSPENDYDVEDIKKRYISDYHDGEFTEE